MIFLFDLGFVKACGGGWVMGFDGGAGDGLWVVIVVMVMGFDRGGGGGDFCGMVVVWFMREVVVVMMVVSLMVMVVKVMGFDSGGGGGDGEDSGCLVYEKDAI